MHVLSLDVPLDSTVQKLLVFGRKLLFGGQQRGTSAFTCQQVKAEPDGPVRAALSSTWIRISCAEHVWKCTCKELLFSVLNRTDSSDSSNMAQTHTAHSYSCVKMLRYIMDEIR